MKTHGTKFKEGDTVRHINSYRVFGEVVSVSDSGLVIGVAWGSGKDKVLDTVPSGYLQLIHRKPFGTSRVSGQPDPNRQWFAVPSYNVAKESHSIVNRDGELVGKFEFLEHAIKVAELWNRGVEK